jgi:hypothetical protein
MGDVDRKALADFLGDGGKDLVRWRGAGHQRRHPLQRRLLVGAARELVDEERNADSDDNERDQRGEFALQIHAQKAVWRSEEERSGQNPYRDGG